MDPVLDRVRAANPTTQQEFAGLANFDALALRPRRRQRRRFLAIPAVGAALAAVIVLPNSAPQASEVLQQAVKAVAVDDGAILYAHSKVHWGPTGGPATGASEREVWVQGDSAIRWLEPGGREEVYREGEGTTVREAGKVTRHPGVTVVPNEIFRARGLLERAKGVGLEEASLNGRDAYVLRWKEQSGPPHWPTIELTMWIDRETYAPLRFTDHSFGKDAKGRPFDQTYTEDIVDFERLPDTPENRKRLQLG